MREVDLVFRTILQSYLSDRAMLNFSPTYRLIGGSSWYRLRVTTTRISTLYSGWRQGTLCGSGLRSRNHRAGQQPPRR